MRKLEDTNIATAYVHETETLLIRKEYPGLDWYVVNLIPLQNLTMEHRAVLQAIVLILSLIHIYSCAIISPLSVSVITQNNSHSDVYKRQLLDRHERTGMCGSGRRYQKKVHGGKSGTQAVP